MKGKGKGKGSVVRTNLLVKPFDLGLLLLSVLGGDRLVAAEAHCVCVGTGLRYCCCVLMPALPENLWVSLLAAVRAGAEAKNEKRRDKE
jgi:hypothetical protein